MATGVYNKAFVSAIDSMLDTREIYKNITDLYNESSFTDVMVLGNKKVPTKQPIYYNFVNDSLFKMMDTTGATVTGSGTASVTTKATVATSGFCRKNDLVIFADGNSGLVYSVSTTAGADTVVINAVSGGNLTHVAGDQLSIYSMAVGENSDTPVNLRYPLTKFYNKYQIFRETSKITDVQNASAIEVNYNGEKKLIAKDHAEKSLRLKGAINAAFIGGDMSATTYADASPALVDQNTVTNGGGGGAVQTTRGMNKYVESYGKLLVAGTLGAYGKADLDALCDTLLATRAPREQLVLGGDKAFRAIATYFKALGSGGVTSARLNVDGKEINFDVDKVNYGSFEFNYTSMRMFDSPAMFSQTVIAKSIYSLPFNLKVKTTEDSGDTKSASAFQIRYVANAYKYGNDMIGEIHAGALNPVNQNGQAANWQVDWITYQGLEFLAPQFAVRQRVNV